jgi:hypothetical protein
MKRIILILIFILITSNCFANLDYLALINNIQLTYIDVYKCTKIGLNKTIPNYKISEANPVAKVFTDRSMYNELFISASLLQIGIFKLFNNKSESHKIINKFILFGIGFVECFVIKEWNHPIIGIKQNAKFEIYFKL